MLLLYQIATSRDDCASECLDFDGASFQPHEPAPLDVAAVHSLHAHDSLEHDFVAAAFESFHCHRREKYLHMEINFTIDGTSFRNKNDSQSIFHGIPNKINSNKNRRTMASEVCA